MLGVFVPVRVAVALSDVDIEAVDCTGDGSQDWKAPGVMGSASHGLPSEASDTPHALSAFMRQFIARVTAPSSAPRHTP